jgi:hypothetical protein
VIASGCLLLLEPALLPEQPVGRQDGHPLGILLREPADVIERRQFFRRQREVDGLQVVLELVTILSQYPEASR